MVAPDGRISAGEGTLHGFVSSDGRVLSLVDTVASDGEVGFFVGMRAPDSVLPVSALAGKFVSVELGGGRFDSPETVVARVRLDGKGNASYTPLFGSARPLQSGQAPYRFDPATGLLIVAESMKGVALEDGQGFLLVGSDPQDLPLSVFLALKTAK